MRPTTSCFYRGAMVRHTSSLLTPGASPVVLREVRSPGTRRGTARVSDQVYHLPRARIHYTVSLSLVFSPLRTLLPGVRTRRSTVRERSACASLCSRHRARGQKRHWPPRDCAQVRVRKRRPCPSATVTLWWSETTSPPCPKRPSRPCSAATPRAPGVRGHYGGPCHRPLCGRTAAANGPGPHGG